EAGGGRRDVGEIAERREREFEARALDRDIQVRRKRPRGRQAGNEPVGLEILDEARRLEVLRVELRLEFGVVGLDVDVEIQANPLEKGLLEGDHADFYRHGKVLQHAELFEQF